MLEYTITTTIDGLSTIFEFFVNRKSVAYIIRVGERLLITSQAGYIILFGTRPELKEV